MTEPRDRARRHARRFWPGAARRGGTFALTMGARQSMGLFLSTLNTHHRPRPGQHQPGVRVRPAVVGPDAAARRHGGRPLRRRPRAVCSACCWSRSAPRSMPLMTTTLRPDLRDRRARRRRCRHGRAVGADGRDDAAGAAGEARHRHAASSTPAARSASSCSCRSRRASPRSAGWVIAMQSMAAIVAAGAAGGVGAARQLGAAAAAPRPACAGRAGARETDARGDRRARCATPSYLLLARGLLRLRLSRRLHRHAPARRRRRVPAAAGGGRVVAGDRRPVQHRRQLRRWAGRSAAGA